MKPKGTTIDAAAWQAALQYRPAFKRPHLREYAEVGSERGLKNWIHRARVNWIAAGCPAGGPNFPPLDEPAKLLEWRLAHTDYQPRKKIYDLASGSAAASTSEPTGTGIAPASPPPSAGSGTVEPLVDIADVQPTDLAAAIDRQGRYVTIAMDALDAARRRPGVTAAELNTRQKTYDSAVAALRENQKSLAAAEDALGERPSLTDLRAELAPMLGAIALAFVELLTDRLGLPRDRARTLADECFAGLTSSRFGTTAPALAAPAPASAAA